MAARILAHGGAGEISDSRAAQKESYCMHCMLMKYSNNNYGQ